MEVAIGALILDTTLVFQLGTPYRQCEFLQQRAHARNGTLLDRERVRDPILGLGQFHHTRQCRDVLLERDVVRLG